MDQVQIDEKLIKEKKRNKTLIIILISFLTILILSVLAIFIFIPFSDTDDIDTTPLQSENEPDYTSQLLDVSEYTDIVIKDYEGLDVSIFDAYSSDSWVDEGDREKFFPYIISYYPIDYYDTEVETEEPVMFMRIVNSQNAVNDQQRALFNKAVEDIQEKNLEADYLDAGELEVFNHTYSSAVYVVSKEIENVDYPKTDEVFSILTVGGYQDLPYANPSKNETFDVNMTIFVFAIKGDNIISLQSIDNLNSLSMGREDYLSCFVEESDDESEGYFDSECLAEVISSDKYDEKAKELAEGLIVRFELVN
jgi:hypothetical protein